MKSVSLLKLVIVQTSFNHDQACSHDNSLMIGDLRPGSTISVDHFESDSWVGPLTPKVVHLQISLLVGVSLLTMNLDFSMLSIKLASMQGRLSRQNRILKNYVRIMVVLLITTWRTMEFSSQILLFNI